MPIAPPVDLRSDTVTRPSPRMREAMARAEVGDDVYREDPTVRRLEERAAALFEREAALLVPSGTMGNLIAIMVHARPGQEAICERDSHVMNWEMGSMAAVAGVMPRPVPGGEGGLLDWPRVEAELQARQDHRAETGLVLIENTHNMGGGTPMPAAVVEAIAKGARGRGVPTHMDAARVFNAAVALGEPVATVTRAVDSLMFCLSKGLGAPVGSMLVGSRAFVDEARRRRKMLGGGMRQAGVLAAAGLMALEEGPARLAEDHANARRIADALAELPPFAIDPSTVRTNIVIAGVRAASPSDAMPALMLAARLAREGVMASPVGRDRIRFVTHCDVSREEVGRAIEAIRAVGRAA